MIILYEFVDFTKVIRIKMFSLFTEVPFDRFGRVAFCPRFSWRLCCRGAVLDNRADPMA